jgi:hypothetical protein
MSFLSNLPNRIILYVTPHSAYIQNDVTPGGAVETYLQDRQPQPFSPLRRDLTPTQVNRCAKDACAVCRNASSFKQSWYFKTKWM